MRTVTCSLSFILLAAALSGCGAGMSNKSTPSAANPTNKIANSKAFIMQSNGVDVLKLTAPAGSKCAGADGSLHFNAEQPNEVEFWIVPGAKTVDEAVGLAGAQIVSEFKDFKPDHTTDLMIAGSSAKRLVGPGHEADDGDPGDADVIVFKVGDRVFISCNHGESLNPPSQQFMLTLVQTAQIP